MVVQRLHQFGDSLRAASCGQGDDAFTMADRDTYAGIVRNVLRHVLWIYPNKQSSPGRGWKTELLGCLHDEALLPMIVLNMFERCF